MIKRNRWQLPDGTYPPMAGGAQTLPSEISYPLGLPSNIQGGLDFLLANPTRVTRVIANIALQGFYVDRIFAPAGPITGGAVVYEQATTNDLYASRDVEQVGPGDEFPVITFAKGPVLTAQVEKFGGKFFVTDEARRRNQIGNVNRALQQLANTIQRKSQQRCLLELTAAIAANSRTAAGTSWKAAADVTDAARTGRTGPVSDLTMVEEANSTLALGYSYNAAIMHPTDWRNFRLATGGDAGSARALLADSGITDLWVTPYKTVGSVYWFAMRMVGELGYEVGLSTETWRDPNGRQQDWWQSFVLPVCYVTDPYAILETTGHNV